MRTPTHCIGENDLRDDFFSKRGWIVIRFAEIQICLETNISNEFVTKIHLLNERFYSQKEMGIVNNFDKIIQIVIGHRLCYKDVFEYIR